MTAEIKPSAKTPTNPLIPPAKLQKYAQILSLLESDHIALENIQKMGIYPSWNYNKNWKNGIAVVGEASQFSPQERRWLKKLRDLFFCHGKVLILVSDIVVVGNKITVRNAS